MEIQLLGIDGPVKFEKCPVHIQDLSKSPIISAESLEYTLN
jgi:hypothetical protein